ILNSSVMSFSRQGCRLMKYSLSPLRCRRLVTVTSLKSRGRAKSELSRVSDTSLKLTALRESLPLKMTSCMLPPRSVLALCSPSTQRMASEMLLLPLPFGPTTAVMPGTNSSSVLSAKDLNPVNSIRFRNMARASPPVHHNTPNGRKPSSKGTGNKKRRSSRSAPAASASVAQSLQRLFRRLLFRFLLRPADARSKRFSAGQHLADEPPAGAAADLFHEPVGRMAHVGLLEHLLQPAFCVEPVMPADVRKQVPFEETDHCLVSLIQVQRPDERLEHVGQKRRTLPSAAHLLAAPEQHEFAEVQPAGDVMQRRLADGGCPDERQLALRHVRKAAEQILGHGQLQHGVAQIFQPLVVPRVPVFVDVRTV